MKNINFEKKLTKRERDLEIARDTGYRQARADFYRKLAEANQTRELELLKARTECMHAAAEVAVTFSKVMYNLNMIINEKLSFNQAQQVTREMRG